MTALAHAALPTVRTMRWWPLAAVTVPVTGLVLLARSEGRPAVPVLVLAAAAVASLSVGALRDDAATTLEALPTSLARRRVLRLALVGAPVLLVWWSLVALGDSTRPGVAALLALTSSGVAVAVWAPARPSVRAGAAVPVLWFAADRLVTGWAGDLLAWWRTDPWPVLAVAFVAIVLGSRR